MEKLNVNLNMHETLKTSKTLGEAAKLGVMLFNQLSKREKTISAVSFGLGIALTLLIINSGKGASFAAI